MFGEMNLILDGRQYPPYEMLTSIIIYLLKQRGSGIRWWGPDSSMNQ